MLRRVSLTIVVCCLVGCAGIGALIWHTVHARYPHTVYRVLITNHFVTSPQALAQGLRAHGDQAADEWVDPTDVIFLVGEPHQSDREVTRDRKTYSSAQVFPLDEFYWGCTVADARSMRAGFSGQGRYFLARKIGPVTRTTLHGLAALRFTVTACEVREPETIWIDPVTDVVRQIQFTVDYQVWTTTYSRQATFPAGTLPRDLFDLPRQRQDLWQSLKDWLGSRVHH